MVALSSEATSNRPLERREERGVPPHLQGLVSHLLRAGVYLSGALLTVGLVVAYVQGATTSPAPGTMLGLPQLPSGLAHGSGLAIVLLGLLVLVLTPLSRVVVSVLLFSASRDRAFTAITLAVLAVLIASIAVGGVRA